MSVRRIVKNGTTFGVSDTHRDFWDWFESPDWESDTVAAYEALVATGVRVIDIGAWIGPTTLFAAAKGADVVALEPDPVAADILEENISHNPELAARITVLRAAISDRDGDATLVSSSGGGDSLSHLGRASSEGASWSVQTVAMQTLLESAAAKGARFVKIDAEGAEYTALPAVRAHLAANRPSLYVSTHPNLLYEKRSPISRVTSGLAALRANHRLLAALAPYRHHYVYERAAFVDIRARNRLRTAVPIPIRQSFLIGSCLFTDEDL